MENRGDIVHKGLVIENNGKLIRVGLLNVANCAGCHAKSSCGVSEIANKELELPVSHYPFSKGQKVSIRFKKSQGFKALFLGYVLPFILLMIVMVCLWVSTQDEPLTALGGLSVLPIYYVTIWMFKSRINTVFSYQLEAEV